MRRALRAVGWTLLALALLAAALWTFRRPLLARLDIRLPEGRAGVAEVTLPDGFAIAVFAEGLAGPRFLELAPDGTLLVAERGEGRVTALPDRDGDGRADRAVVVADGFDRPSSLALRPGTRELYVGETTRVTRLVLGDGLDVVSREAVIDDLPGVRLHVTTTVAFDATGERLFVAMGSSCNVCDEDDERLAAVDVYDPDGGGRRPYTVGLRNAVGLAREPETGRMWATNNGRDLLGNDLPPETIYALAEGADAGWPRCHAGTVPDPDFGGEGACDGVLQPVATDTAHSAPLGAAFYTGTQFPEAYRGDLFVAYHGSWNRDPPTGYAVVRVPVEGGEAAGPPEPFATGWLAPDGTSTGRPVDVAVAADGALFVSDDKAGLIYRVAYGGR